MLRKMLCGVLMLAAALSPMPCFALWQSAGVLTNPTANTILADTDVLSGGESYYTFFCASTVASRTLIVVRNAANNADVGATQSLVTAANGNIITPPLPISVPVGGRIVLRLTANVTGTMHCSIFREGA